MTVQEIKQLEAEYILHSYGRVDVALEKGKNATAWDAAGKQYIDFTSGIGVNALGYADEGWAKAVANQAGQLQHMSNYYYSEVNGRLAKELAAASGMAKSFFCNSGAEANECAIKIARGYGAPRKANRIVTLSNSFHGRTLTTLAATGQDAFHEHFLPLTPGFLYAPPNDIEQLKAMLDETVCGVMIEMVQGEGGVVPLDAEYVKELRTLCDEYDMLLMVDEVQTGVGRTGSFFAYQAMGVQPDVVTCAKGLGGGLPIGVCLVNEQLRDCFTPGMNGSTFGGNPVVCAGALEVVNRVRAPGFLGEVSRKGADMRKALLQMPEVDFVRGKGLMLGIQLKKGNAHEVLVACAAQGLLVLTAKELVRFLPPLTITDEEMKAGLAIFQQVLKA